VQHSTALVALDHPPPHPFPTPPPPPPPPQPSPLSLAEALAGAVASSTALVALDLSDNYLGEGGAKVLAEALAKNKSIKVDADTGGCPSLPTANPPHVPTKAAKWSFSAMPDQIER
jgi:hypothetical protein